MKTCLRKLITVLMMACVTTTVYASEQRAWPIITFTCDVAKNEVKIKNEVKWGEAGKTFPFNEAQGTYNPWDLVKAEDRGEYKFLSEKAQLSLDCELKGIKYRFVVRPKIFNVNGNGTCGDRLSVKVSIYQDQSMLLEDKDMEPFCIGNAPILMGIKVEGGSNKVQLFEIPRSQFF